MTYRTKIRFLACTGATAALALSLAAFAQDAAAEQEYGVGEIIVTAQKRSGTRLEPTDTTTVDLSSPKQGQRSSII